MKRTPHGPGQNLAALALGLLLSGLLLEGLTRWFIPDPDLIFENRLALFTPDDTAGYRNRPNFLGYAQASIRVQTNALGFRGPELLTAKAPATRRILGIGDSVTFGTGVQEPQTFLRLLESGFDQQQPPRTEVVNLGVIGYSLRQELLTLKHRGLPLAPDIVLLHFVLNDAYPTEDPFFNIHTFHEPRKTDVRRREYHHLPPPPPTPTASCSPSYAARSTRPPPQPPHPPLWPPGSYELLAWPYMQEDLRECKRLAAVHGFRFGVLIFPRRVQCESGSPSAPYPQPLIKDFLRSESIPFLDLYATLGETRDPFIDQLHLTTAGHTAVARATARFLSEQGW
ncbi:MAG: SGNH/GDSL hydrolase family protein [Bryobacterales bacterium]|nr:SGNH/GDSL hydrolase family protein [Bryobacterales bacterium]